MTAVTVSDEDTCDRCETPGRIHVGHEREHGFDGLCDACLDALAEVASRLNAAVAQIEAHGFTVQFVEWCENPDTPGLLGSIRGVTDRQRRLVRIGRRANPTAEDLAATAEHELRHVTDPEWDCGNRDVFGRGGRT